MSDPYRAIRAKIESGRRLTSNERKLAADMIGEGVRTRQISGRDGRAMLTGLISTGRAPEPLRGQAASPGRPTRADRQQATLQAGGRLSGRAAARAAGSGWGGWQGANADIK